MRVYRLAAVLFSCLMAFIVGMHRDDEGLPHPPLSQHYRRRLQGSLVGPKVVVVADGGGTTAGPFGFSRDIYADGGDLLATANGRAAVLQGIPLTIEFVLYAVVNNASNAQEEETLLPLENAEVYLWQADTAGEYSFVSSMGTADETWLRAKDKSDANGTAVFQTILPGWYPGRAIHWHFRVQLDQQEDYYVTSQLFVTDTFLESYRSHGLYAQNTGRLTPNLDDGVFRNLGDVATDLILIMEGNNDNGYTTTFHLGIDSGDAGVLGEGQGGNQADSDANKAVQPVASPSAVIEPSIAVVRFLSLLSYGSVLLWC